VPSDSRSVSSYPLIVMHSLVSTTTSEYPNCFSNFRVHKFRLEPPSIKTLLMICLWIRTSMCKASLCELSDVGRSFFKKVR